MQFTPQQLAGGPKFSSSTRIGNWQEELAIQESKLKSFQKRTTSGSSSLRKQQLKLTKYNEIVPHSYSEDGIIRFGDSVIFSHDSTGSLLACDPSEDQIPGQNKFLVTGLKDTIQPRARNTFRIVRPPSHLKNFEDDENDPILRIGQPFCIACDDALLVDSSSSILQPALYIASTKKTERSATRTTNRQMVFLTTLCDADVIWIATKPSRGHIQAAERLLAEGTPLTIADEIQITHRQTNMYLMCDPLQSMRTEFGFELECYANRSAMTGKIGLLVSEFKGASTAQTLTKPDSCDSSWHLVTAEDPTARNQKRPLPPPSSVDNLLAELKTYILLRGRLSFWDLREYFQSLEQKIPGKGKMDRDDLKDCLIAWGCPFDGNLLGPLIDLVDERKTGLVDWRNFIRLIRGAPSYSRQDILIDVFSRMDTKGDGVVSVSDLSQHFDGCDHPLVENGFSHQEAFDHLLRCSLGTDAKPSRSAVTYEMFSDYYSDLSAAIDDGAIFEAIVRSNWKEQ